MEHDVIVMVLEKMKNLDTIYPHEASRKWQMLFDDLRENAQQTVAVDGAYWSCPKCHNGNYPYLVMCSWCKTPRH